MSTIQNLFQLAQLSEAAYADFAKFGADTIAGLVDAKFSAAQATDFVNHWRFIDQYTAPQSSIVGFTGTGFSATVFESIDQPGKYVFAIRGTEPSSQKGSE